MSGPDGTEDDESGDEQSRPLTLFQMLSQARERTDRLAASFSAWKARVDRRLEEVRPRIVAFGERLEVAFEPVVRLVRGYYAGMEAVANDLLALTPLAKHGWALSTFGIVLSPELHRAAAERVRSSPIDASELMIEAWSEKDAQRRLAAIVPYLYSPDRRAIGERRRELFERAVDHYEHGRFEEVVLLVYSQLDGLVRDAADAEDMGAVKLLFSRPRSSAQGADQFKELVARADSVLADEHDIFLSIRDVMTDGVKTTTLEDNPSRHGVMHGRVLGYGTKLRAAQSFAFLAATIELLVALHAEDEDFPMLGETDPPLDEADEGLLFLLFMTLYAPVRAIYVAGRDGTVALVRDQDSTRAAVDEPGLRGREDDDPAAPSRPSP